MSPPTNGAGREALAWCLLGPKAGDNTQVRALAEELRATSSPGLSLRWEEKYIRPQPWELLSHLALRITLAGIDRASAAALQPPWPDLVISAGRRNEPVARWIHRRSGGRTRLVHVGRPWAPLNSYDLIVSTPQYELPERPNVYVNQLPLHRVDAAARAEAGAVLQDKLGFAAPRIAVLVGGNSGPYVFTAHKGAVLGSAALDLAESMNAALMVTGSRRTPTAAWNAMWGQLRPSDYTCAWGRGDYNPYQGMLALADAFIVTGESVSMLAEAFCTGKPVYIFDMGDGETPWWRLLRNYHYKPLGHRLAMALGPRRMRRDVSRFHRRLLETGRVFRLRTAGVAEFETPHGPEGVMAWRAMADVAKTEGAMAEAARANGALAKGTLVQGDVAEGDVAEGDVAEGDVAEGKVAEGKVAEGKVAEGNVAQGNATEGNVATGKVADGALAQLDIAEKELMETAAAVRRLLEN